MMLMATAFQDVAVGVMFQFAGRNCLKLDPATGQQAVDLGSGNFIPGLANGTLVTPCTGATVSL